MRDAIAGREDEWKFHRHMSDGSRAKNKKTLQEFPPLWKMNFPVKIPDSSMLHLTFDGITPPVDSVNDCSFRSHQKFHSCRQLERLWTEIALSSTWFQFHLKNLFSWMKKNLFGGCESNSNETCHSFYCQPLIKNYKRVGWSNSNPLLYSLPLFTPHSRPSVHPLLGRRFFFIQIQNRLFRFIIRIGANFHLHSGSQAVTKSDVTCAVVVTQTAVWSDSEKFYTSRFCCASPFSSGVVFCMLGVFLLFHFSRRSDFARNGSLVVNCELKISDREVTQLNSSSSLKL